MPSESIEFVGFWLLNPVLPGYGQKPTFHPQKEKLPLPSNLDSNANAILISVFFLTLE